MGHERYFKNLVFTTFLLYISMVVEEFVFYRLSESELFLHSLF